jgi:hypothetical protein
MNVIGIRAEPSGFTWAVVQGTRDRPILVGVDTASAPTSYEEPDALKWHRARLATLVTQYQATAIAIRLPESFGRQGNTESDRRRSRLEGVIMELGAANGMGVVAGSLKTIGSRQGVAKPKEELASADLRGLDWSTLNAKKREAVFAAASALPDGDVE